MTGYILTAHPDDDRIADVLIALEARPQVAFTPLAVLDGDTAHAHVILRLSPGATYDLTPVESGMIALGLRMERPYPGYDALAGLFETAMLRADAALLNATGRA